MEVRHQSWDSPRCRIFKSLSEARPMSRQLCLQCKGGRLLCGQASCPLLAKIDLSAPVESLLKEEMFGPSPSVFVGWKDYPSVNVGPMTSLERDGCERFDNPGSWYGLGFDDIIRMRSLMVRGKRKHAVWGKDRFTERMQEIALSAKPVDVEVHYSKKPRFSLSFSPISQPMGASADLKSYKVADNPHIPQKVDYVLSDDLTASAQVSTLYDSDFDIYYLSNVFSSGAMGLKERKRLVPTRWSITAIDDILGKELMGRIRHYPEISDFQVFENTYLGNHFEVLMIPGAWEFEQFEAWAPNTLWTMSYDDYTIVEEHEAHGGRTDYAIDEGGGYYAGRFAVAEALNRMRRQARCVIFREVYDSYVMPVGVWEVRENVRKAMSGNPRIFKSLKAALNDIGGRLMIPIDRYVGKSRILRQRRITDYT